MQDESSDDVTTDANIFEEYQFLLSFPFDEYHMRLEKDDSYATSSGLDPVIIRAAGGIVEPEFIIFDHISKYTKITLTFYTYDIKYIYDNSHKIKKLDSVRELLDMGLNSDSILDKIDAIKNGEQFIKKLGSSLVAGKSFDNVLDSFIESGEYKIEKSDLRKIRSMYKTIDEDKLDDGVKTIVRSFYNIHLHHIKILLGIVIASKIH